MTRNQVSYEAAVFAADELRNIFNTISIEDGAAVMVTENYTLQIELNLESVIKLASELGYPIL